MISRQSVEKPAENAGTGDERYPTARDKVKSRGEPRMQNATLSRSAIFATDEVLSN
jgi:hypothetical protein